MKASKKRHADFDTHIAGIPCGIRVLMYDPGTSRLIHSASLEPNDPEEFDFEVLDRKGYVAYWLAAKMSEDDEERILEEYKDAKAPCY